MQSHWRWLARGQWLGVDDGVEPLVTVLEKLGVPGTPTGLAALRLWGQTGARPCSWVAAADPVYLEALLDHIRVHALCDEQLPEEDLRELVALLHAELANGPREYLQIHDKAYLRGGDAFDTARCSSACIDGLEPDEFLPRGAAAREHDRLTGELQLLLHDAPVNRLRQANGRLPANSVWFWGGGLAPENNALALPTLVAKDALFRGFWNSCGSRITDWQDEPSWHEHASSAFIAVVPPGVDNANSIVKLLSVVRTQLMRGKVHRLSVLFGNRLVVQFRRLDLFAFWRSGSAPALEGETR